MPLKGEAHEISFKNILKYISFPLQFFFKVKTNYSLPTDPLTRALKLYWFYFTNILFQQNSLTKLLFRDLYPCTHSVGWSFKYIYIHVPLLQNYDTKR